MYICSSWMTKTIAQKEFYKLYKSLALTLRWFKAWLRLLGGKGMFMVRDIQEHKEPGFSGTIPTPKKQTVTT